MIIYKKYSFPHQIIQWRLRIHNMYIPIRHNDYTDYQNIVKNDHFDFKLINKHLVHHKRTHAVEKPYFCDICLKSFSYNSSLGIHKQSHIGESPYSCDIYSKAFSWKDLYLHHKWTQHRRGTVFTGRQDSRRIVYLKRVIYSKREFRKISLDREFPLRAYLMPYA